MKTLLTTLPILLLMTASLPAQDSDPATIATLRLTVAYQCSFITGETGRYEWAKANAQELLAGSQEPTADQLIAAVEQQGENNELGLDAATCADLLQSFE